MVQGWLFLGYFVAVALGSGAVGGPGGAVLRIVGGALAVGGATLAVAGLRGLGPALSVYPTPPRDGVLVAGGAYRLVRHPIYGGIVVGAVGLAAASASVAAFLAALVLGVFFVAKSSHEERHLVARYPGYVAYRSEVRRRLLPFVF